MVPKLTITQSPFELGSCTTLVHLKQFHALLTTAGFSGDATTLSKILRCAALSFPGDINYASLLFHQIENPKSSLWNAMLQGHALHFQYDTVVAQFSQMFRNGATPNEHTFPVLLKSLSSAGCFINSLQIYAQILKLGLSTDFFIQNSLLSCYAKGGFLDYARKLFDEMLHRDGFSWNAMVLGHVKNSQPVQGLGYFINMKALGVEIDEVVIVSVLNGSAMTGNIWLGMSIQAFYVESGRVERDVFVVSALIDMYAKCGCCVDARQVFDEMPFQNVVCWSSLISGYVHCNRFKDTLTIFCSMLVYGPKPNQVTFVSVLAACAHLGASEQGRCVHSYMYRVGLKLNSFIGTAMIDMYAKCGLIGYAVSVFQKLSIKDMYCWSALINGLAFHGLGLDCLHLFSQMLLEGVQPNEVTLLGVLGACSHCGFIEEGKVYFDRMQSVYGIKPKIEHYGCMVDLLCRAGQLEDALYFIENMPMEPNAGIWGALFRACMIHRDVVLGEIVGKLLVGIQPELSGGYMLLANMYSSSQRWVEAASMRMEMRERKVEKVAGCSWLKLNGVLFEFLASDGSHAQAENLFECLQGLSVLMRLQDSYSYDDQMFFSCVSC